ncbi:EexN family lipoprotein [Burkholderia multivorans]|uniref:EexN family lipoprotein n=1 Tax=Burkholderia multivorans TaxID=87883 RepID=UPI001C240AA2|nr:EexN family lipoprotein [Burkholderia multivorans]MBU9610637.1 EexN family lipoprotein [Burkholderia multivorans]
MNKMIMLLALTVMLAACGKSAPTETVDSLAANPARLKELLQRCKSDRAQLGDELCNRVAEATNRRFMGNGKVPYTPPKDSPKF